MTVLPLRYTEFKWDGEERVINLTLFYRTKCDLKLYLSRCEIDHLFILDSLGIEPCQVYLQSEQVSARGTPKMPWSYGKSCYNL